MKQTRIPEELVSIGADPEFVILNNRLDMLPARNYFRGTRATLGTDGCSAVAEIRPKWKWNAVELTRTIRNILRRAKAKIPRDAIMVAGNGWKEYATGGHIHLGIGSGSSGRQDLALLLPNSGDIIKALDLVTIALASIDEKSFLRLRHKGHYGNLSEFNNVAWGIEYRSVPSWLTTPAICSATLALAHAICIDKKLGKNLNKIVALSTKLKNRMSNWNLGDCELTVEERTQIIKVVKNLTAYKQNWNNYKILIDHLLLRLEKKILLPNVIDESLWGLTNIRPYQRKFKIFRFAKEDANMPEIMQAVGQTTVKSRHPATFHLIGLNQSRPSEIITNDNSIRLVAEQLGFTTGLSADINLSWGDRTVGIRLDARVDKKAKVIELLKKVKQCAE